MSGKGNCYDNAVVERSFKTIKSEPIWPVSWQTRSQAENAVARYIDGFYNPIRRHSTLGYQSPSTSRWRAESEQSARHNRSKTNMRELRRSVGERVVGRESALCLGLSRVAPLRASHRGHHPAILPEPEG